MNAVPPTEQPIFTEEKKQFLTKISRKFSKEQNDKIYEVIYNILIDPLIDNLIAYLYKNKTFCKNFTQTEVKTSPKKVTKEEIRSKIAKFVWKDAFECKKNHSIPDRITQELDKFYAKTPLSELTYFDFLFIFSYRTSKSALMLLQNSTEKELKKLSLSKTIHNINFLSLAILFNQKEILQFIYQKKEIFSGNFFETDEANFTPIDLAAITSFQGSEGNYESLLKVTDELLGKIINKKSSQRALDIIEKNVEQKRLSILRDHKNGFGTTADILRSITNPKSAQDSAIIYSTIGRKGNISIDTINKITDTSLKRIYLGNLERYISKTKADPIFLLKVWFELSDNKNFKESLVFKTLEYAIKAHQSLPLNYLKPVGVGDAWLNIKLIRIDNHSLVSFYNLMSNLNENYLKLPKVGIAAAHTISAGDQFASLQGKLIMRVTNPENNLIPIERDYYLSLNSYSGLARPFDGYPNTKIIISSDGEFCLEAITTIESGEPIIINSDEKKLFDAFFKFHRIENLIKALESPIKDEFCINTIERWKYFFLKRPTVFWQYLENNPTLKNQFFTLIIQSILADSDEEKNNKKTGIDGIVESIFNSDLGIILVASIISENKDSFTQFIKQSPLDLTTFLEKLCTYIKRNPFVDILHILSKEECEIENCTTMFYPVIAWSFLLNYQPVYFFKLILMRSFDFNQFEALFSFKDKMTKNITNFIEKNHQYSENIWDFFQLISIEDKTLALVITKLIDSKEELSTFSSCFPFDKPFVNSLNKKDMNENLKDEMFLLKFLVYLHSKARTKSSSGFIQTLVKSSTIDLKGKIVAINQEAIKLYCEKAFPDRESKYNQFISKESEVNNDNNNTITKIESQVIPFDQEKQLSLKGDNLNGDT